MKKFFQREKANTEASNPHPLFQAEVTLDIEIGNNFVRYCDFYALPRIGDALTFAPFQVYANNKLVEFVEVYEVVHRWSYTNKRFTPTIYVTDVTEKKLS